MDVLKIGTRGPLFFMHIPKTAGMSMRLYLSEQYQSNEICPAERWQDLRGREEEVRSFRLVRGHFRYNLRQLVAEDARMLVVLREPLRRTVSALLHLRRDPDFHRDYQIAKDLTLAEMIRHPQLMSYQRDVQARFLCASRSAAAVAERLEEGRRNNKPVDAGDLEVPPALQLAVERLETIDFVGLTEDLGAVVSTMAGEMNYHPPLYFPFINGNPDRVDPLLELTKDDLDIIRRHNEVDLKLYEFARKLIRSRNFDRGMRQMIGAGIYQIPPGSFEIPMSGVIPGSGWYPAEHNEAVSWRWTGPDWHFTIEVPLRPDVSYRFVMTFSDPRPSGPGNLVAELNDMPVVFELWPEGNHHKCELLIDQALLAKSSGFCRIQINTGATVRLTPPDVRLLGILVRRVEFTCLDA